MEDVLAWAKRVGQDIDELTDEQRKEILQMVVEQVVIDRDNNVDITLAIPIDDDSPEPDSPEPGSPGPESVELDSAEADSVSVASETSKFLILSSLVGLFDGRQNHLRIVAGNFVGLCWTVGSTSPISPLSA